jgi:hypothetical protein
MEMFKVMNREGHLTVLDTVQAFSTSLFQFSDSPIEIVSLSPKNSEKVCDLSKGATEPGFRPSDHVLRQAQKSGPSKGSSKQELVLVSLSWEETNITILIVSYWANEDREPS